MSIRDLSNIKGLYGYLKEIDFENRVKKEVSTIKKVKNSENFDCFVSDFVMLNWAFGIVYDVYEKIQFDLLAVDNTAISENKKCKKGE